MYFLQYICIQTSLENVITENINCFIMVQLNEWYQENESFSSSFFIVFEIFFSIYHFILSDILYLYLFLMYLLIDRYICPSSFWRRSIMDNSISMYTYIFIYHLFIHLSSLLSVYLCSSKHVFLKMGGLVVKCMKKRFSKNYISLSIYISSFLSI